MNTGKDRLSIDRLIEKLQDSDPMVRIHAAMLVGAMGDDAEPAVPALVELLQFGDVQDRRLAALTLGEIGPAAEEAIPALFAAVDDDDEAVSEMAETALELVDVVEDDADAA